jgi:amidohydrolase
VGHACGHNISCTSAVGAGVASRRAVDQFGGTIIVIGTPAEELQGGKAIMANRGGFNGLDAAMIVHPGTHDTATIKALACHTLDVEFFGKAAHAAAQPESGINALEAMINSFTAINSLRQHIKETSRIHGVITDGGKAANVVPDHSAAQFLVRAMEDAYLDELKERVINCFKGAAIASGARLEYRWAEIRYAPMYNNLTLARLFKANMHTLRPKISLFDPREGFGSTDMGNVSQVVPSIHPYVAIAPEEVLAHSPQFAEAAASEAGMRGLVDAARALAMTVVDLLASPETVARARKEFEKTVGK